MIITSPAQVPLVSADELIAAAKTRFGNAASPTPAVAESPADLYIDVTVPGEPGFYIIHNADNLSVGLDGTVEQNATTAAWFRSLLPTEFPRLIAFDDGWTGHVDLVPGITPGDVTANWISHSDPDWAAGDPDLS